MIDVSTKPIGSDGPFQMVRMGDPQDAPGQDPRIKVLEYPYPGSGSFASWPVGATNWQSKARNPDGSIDDSCYFQVSSTGTALHAERAGPLDWLVIPGLF